jgi:hypothetical protein
MNAANLVSRVQREPELLVQPSSLSVVAPASDSKRPHKTSRANCSASCSGPLPLFVAAIRVNQEL